MTAPELAAAMAETRLMRERIATLADELDTAAAKAQAAHDDAKNITLRLVEGFRADLCRDYAAKLREAAS